MKPRRAQPTPRKTTKVQEDDTTPVPPQHDEPANAIITLTGPINHVAERRLPSLMAGLLAANIPSDLCLVASEFIRACVQSEGNAAALIEECPTVLQAVGTRLLTDTNLCTRDNLLVTLRVLSESDRHRVDLVEAVGLVQALVNVLSSGTTNEVFETARILMNVTESEQAAQLISSNPGVRLGVVTAASDVAASGSDASKPACLAILANMCRCADRLFATSTECLEQLAVIVRLLLHGRPNVQFAACRPLAEFFSSPEIRHHLDSNRISVSGHVVSPNEVVAGLIKIASETSGDKSTVFASLALCLAGASKESLAQSVALLSQELQGSSAVSAIRSLAHLCEELPHAQSHFLETKSLELLVTLLDSGSLEVKEAAVLLISALSLGHASVIASTPGTLRSLMALSVPANGSDAASQTALLALSRISADSTAVTTLAQYPNVTASLLALMERPDAAALASVVVRHVTAVNKSSTAVATPKTVKKPAPSAAKSVKPLNPTKPAATKPTKSAQPEPVVAESPRSLLFIDARPSSSDIFVFQYHKSTITTLYETRDLDVVWAEAEQHLYDGAEELEACVDVYVSGIWEFVKRDARAAKIVEGVQSCAVSASLAESIEFETAVVDRTQAALASAWQSKLGHAVGSHLLVTGAVQRCRHEYEAAKHLAGPAKLSAVASLDFVSSPSGVLSLCSNDQTCITALSVTEGHASDHVTEAIKEFAFGTCLFFLDDFRFACEQLLESLKSASGSKHLATLERVMSQNIPISEARSLFSAPEVTAFESKAAEDVAHTLSIIRDILMLGSFASNTQVRVQVLFEGEVATWSLGLALQQPALFQPSTTTSSAPSSSVSATASAPDGLAKNGQDETSEGLDEAASPTGDEAMGQWSKSLHALVSSTDKAQRDQALLCAGAFADPALGYQVTRTVGIPALEELLGGSDAELRSAATDILEQYLSQATPEEINAASSSLSTSLTRVLGLRHVAAESRAVFAAVKALVFLSSLSNVPPSLLSTESIAALVELSSSASAEQRESALLIFSNLTNKHSAQLPSGAVNAIIDASIAAMRSSSESQVDLAVSVCSNLAYYSAELLSAAVLEAFEGVLNQSPVASATQEIIRVLSHVFELQGSRLTPALERSTIHSAVLQQLDQNAIDAVLPEALHLLTAFTSQQFAEALVQSSTIWDNLVTAFDGATQTRNSAAQLTASMARLTGEHYDTVESVFADVQKGQSIIRGIARNCALSEPVPTRRQALQALHDVTETHPHARTTLVKEAPLVQALSAAIGDKDVTLAELASAVVLYTASDANNQPLLGEVPQLIDALCQGYAHHGAAVAKHVSGTFALLTQSADNHETLGKKAQVIATLTKLTASSDEQVAEYASRAFANLLVLEQNQVALFRDNALLNALVAVAKSENAGAQAAAAAALSFFANNPTNSEAVATHGSLIPTLLHIVRTGSETAQEDSLVGLGAVCESTAVQDLIGKTPGGLAAIVAVLSMHHNTPIVEAASWVLANLSRNDANKILLSEGQTFNLLAECLDLEATPANHVIKENCASAVAILTRDADNQVLVSKNGPLSGALVRCVDPDSGVTDATRSQSLLAVVNVATARNSSLRFLSTPSAVRSIVANGLSEQQTIHEAAGRVVMLASRDHDARSQFLHDPSFAAMLANLLADNRRSQAHDLALRTLNAIVADRDVSLAPLVACPELVSTLRNMGDTCPNQKNKTFARELIGKLRVPVHTPRGGASGRVATPRK